MEFIGMLIAFFLSCGLAVLLGLLTAGLAFLLFWRRRRPKKIILIAASVPLLTIPYWIFCAIVFAIVVPNQPDLFFGDFSEPLPNGYVLNGLAKMPEYADVSTGTANRLAISGVESLEQDGEVLLGAYSHPEYGGPQFFAPPGVNYFRLDTRSGRIDNYGTLQELNSAAGHPVRLVESQFFRSQLPARIAMRRIENCILFVPPIAVFLFILLRLFRLRFFTQQRSAGFA